MSILPLILCILAGSLVYLFVFWRRLKEDYSTNLIFNSAFFILTTTLTLALVFYLSSRLIQSSRVFDAHGLWFWGGFTGFIAGVTFCVTKFKLKAVETYEASVIGLMYVIVMLYALNAIETRQPFSLIFAAIAVICTVLFYIVDRRYRSFHWYKSGKVGFSGLFSSGLYFLSRIVIAYFSPATFSVIGKLDSVLSAVVAFLIFFSLYNLSES